MARAVTRATLLIARDPDAAKRATRPFLKEMDDADFRQRLGRPTCRPFPPAPTSPKPASRKNWNSKNPCCRRTATLPVPYAEAVDASFVRKAHAGTGALSDEPLIEYRNVGRRFLSRAGAVIACEQVNLTVQQGEFLAVVGPSGCGKSTLLNMAAGLLAPTAGQVFYRGAPVRSPNTDVGYLTQRDTLLPWRTVEDNVAIALELRGRQPSRPPTHGACLAATAWAWPGSRSPIRRNCPAACGGAPAWRARWPTSRKPS